MKGGLLSGVYALAALRHLGCEAFGQITYLCVPGEEIDQPISNDLICHLGRQADAALTLEAARENGDIVTARKGVRWYSLEASGHAAHAGVEPEKGRNAIVALAGHITPLSKLNGFRPGVTLNIGVIEGGTAPNVVPEYARVRVDLRAFSEEDLQAVVGAVEKQLGLETVPGVQVTMKLEGPGNPPMPRTPAVEALERLAQEAAGQLGFEVKGARTGGVSDANLVASMGTPVLDGLGPIGGLDHGPDEYIELASIVPRTALLTQLIMAIAEWKNPR
jgi:glutamate carboxypeptidase